MSGDASHAERFMINVDGLLTLTAEIVEIAKTMGVTKLSPKLISVIAGLLKSYKGPKLLERFIDNSFNYWDQIFVKDEDFFNENASKVFGSLPMDNVNMFKDLVGHPEIVDAETKATIWQYFHSFVKISIKYMNDHRTKYQSHKIDDLVVKWKVKIA